MKGLKEIAAVSLQRVAQIESMQSMTLTQKANLSDSFNEFKTAVNEIRDSTSKAFDALLETITKYHEEQDAALAKQLKDLSILLSGDND